MSDAGRALARALIARGGGASRIIAASERPWASLLFDGARHVVEVELFATAADRFVDGIGGAEFTLSGHILADIGIVAREAREDRVRFRLEALTLVNADTPPERTGMNPRLRGHGRDQAALCR